MSNLFMQAENTVIKVNMALCELLEEYHLREQANNQSDDNDDAMWTTDGSLALIFSMSTPKHPASNQSLVTQPKPATLRAIYVDSSLSERPTKTLTQKQKASQ